MSSSRATQKVCDGPTALTSLTRRALTLSVATTLPERAKAAGDANNKPSNQHFTLRMVLCYSIGRGNALGCLSAVAHLTVSAGHTAPWTLALMYSSLNDTTHARKLRRSHPQGQGV